MAQQQNSEKNIWHRTILGCTMAFAESVVLEHHAKLGNGTSAVKKTITKGLIKLIKVIKTF